MLLQKKLIAMIASGLLVFGVAACEGDSTTDDTGTDDTTTDTTTDTEMDAEPTELMTPTESATE